MNGAIAEALRWRVRLETKPMRPFASATSPYCGPGLDSSIIGNPKTWEASGHVAGFSDPMVDDKTTKKRYRADQLFYADMVVDGESLGFITLVETADTEKDAQKMAEQFKKKAGKRGELTPVVLKCVAEASEAELLKIPPPDDPSRPGDLTAPVAFNLMFKTTVGAKADS